MFADKPYSFANLVIVNNLKGFNMGYTIQRLPCVLNESAVSRSALYLRMKNGLWTKPVSLGIRSVGWPASETEALNAAYIAGKSEDEIRQLVTKLEALRKEAA